MSIGAFLSAGSCKKQQKKKTKKKQTSFYVFHIDFRR